MEMKDSRFHAIVWMLFVFWFTIFIALIVVENELRDIISMLQK